MAGKQNHITAIYFKILVRLVCHPDQCAEFLSLRTGAQDQDTLIRQLIYIRTDLSDHIFRDFDISEVLTEPDIVDHRSSCQEYDLIVFDSAFYDLDDPSDIGSKSGNNHSFFAIPDDTIQIISDDFL